MSDGGKHRALRALFEQADSQFFSAHPDRRAHIRNAYDGEYEAEFRELGPHDRKRRRIVIWRVPANNPHYDPDCQPLMPIPFLAFADETIEDTDEILLPLVDDIMRNAAD